MKGEPLEPASKLPSSRDRRAGKRDERDEQKSGDISANIHWRFFAKADEGAAPKLSVAAEGTFETVSNSFFDNRRRYPAMPTVDVETGC